MYVKPYPPIPQYCIPTPLLSEAGLISGYYNWRECRQEALRRLVPPTQVCIRRPHLIAINVVGAIRVYQHNAPYSSQLCRPYMCAQLPAM